MVDWPAILQAATYLRDRGHVDVEARLATALQGPSVRDICRADVILADAIRSVLTGLLTDHAYASHPERPSSMSATDLSSHDAPFRSDWEVIDTLRAARRALATASWERIPHEHPPPSDLLDRWLARLRDEQARVATLSILAAQPNVRGLVLDALDVTTVRALVLGNFKRGKSTLINAMLGVRLLPARMTPATAVLCTLHHADTLQIIVTFTRESGRPPAALTLAELEDHVCIPDPTGAEGDQDGLARRFRPDVAGVDIGIPWPLLRDGLQLTDSPGLNESGERQALTLAAVERADLIVYVLSATEPLSADEEATIAGHLWDAGHRSILFVANYANRVDEEELPLVQQRLSTLLAAFCHGDQALPLFLVGARPALLARERQDAVALAASGLPPIEESITALTGRERRSLLRRSRLPCLQAAAGIVEGQAIAAVVAAISALSRNAEDHRLLTAQLAAAERASYAAEQTATLRRQLQAQRLEDCRKSAGQALAALSAAIDDQASRQSLTWLLWEMPYWLSDRLAEESSKYSALQDMVTGVSITPVPVEAMRDRARLVAHYQAEARRLLTVPDTSTGADPETLPAYESGVDAVRRSLNTLEQEVATIVREAQQALDDARTLDLLLSRLQSILLED